MRFPKTLTLLMLITALVPALVARARRNDVAAGPALRPCGFYLGMCGLGAAPAGAPGISSAALQPGMCRRSGEFTSPWRRKAAATVCRPKGRLYGRGLPRSQALYARAGRKHGARRARMTSLAQILIEHPAVSTTVCDIMASEKTRTAKAAVRATNSTNFALPR